MIGEKEETPQNDFVFHKTCGMQKMKRLKRGENRVWRDRYQPLVSVIANQGWLHDQAGTKQDRLRRSNPPWATG